MILKISCIVMIILGIIITIFPSKIFNGIRKFFLMEEFEKEDFRIMLYRISGIIGIFIFAGLLSQLF